MEEQKAWDAGENLLSGFCLLNGDLQIAGADVKNQWGREKVRSLRTLAVSSLAGMASSLIEKE